MKNSTIKTVFSCIAAVAAAAAVAAVTPDTPWQKIPLTNTVNQVAEEAGIVRSADLAAPYDSNGAYEVGSVATQSNRLYRCAQAVPAGTPWSQASSSFVPETPLGVFTNFYQAAKRIAMFVIPVNDRASTMTNQYFFAGFELKASTNNFSSLDENVNLQFYAQSEVADDGYPAGAAKDKMRLYVCSSHGGRDLRAYTRITNTIDWDYPLNKVVVLVDTGCLVRHPEEVPGEWLNEGNRDLIWCYLRDRDQDGVEEEAGTGRPMWQPVTPVRWFDAMPSWAEQ